MQIDYLLRLYDWGFSKTMLKIQLVTTQNLMVLALSIFELYNEKQMANTGIC